jgi:hypothetical protein
VDDADDVCLCYSHNHAFRHSGDGCQTLRLSGQAPFPKEIAGSQKCDHGFLPLLGDDGRLHLAAPNVENGIRRIALPEHNLILPIIGNGSSAVYLREKRFGIEREPCFAVYCQALLIARGILWGGCERVAKGTMRKPDRQVGIEQAFTDRLERIQ